MKEKIIRAMNYRGLQLRNSGMNSLSSKVEMKLAKITVNAVWAASLLKTSLTVTKTPMTTLKSIVKVNLNLKNGKPKIDEDSRIVGDELNGDAQQIPLQVMRITQRML